ncbi:hypothetical protein [Amycolatopsis sp. cmx-8-4]|uniref:hypothetical protein n=1 Tax=Amycolatopsis sp. cmx-8-4 TaxID=2790947 RepID=UPI00397B0694
MAAQDRFFLDPDCADLVRDVSDGARQLRARLALLAAAGPVHHAVAAYATTGDTTDTLASILAEHRLRQPVFRARISMPRWNCFVGRRNRGARSRQVRRWRTRSGGPSKNTVGISAATQMSRSSK